MVTHETTPLSFAIVVKTTIVSFNVIKSSYFSPLILDLSWLIEFNPLINQKTKELIWKDEPSNF